MVIYKLMNALRRRVVWYVCWLLPVQKNKVIASSYYGKGYGDNPKYIVEELLRDSSEYKIVWVVQDKDLVEPLPNGVIPCLKDSIKYIYHITTAKVWIDNCRKSFFYKKKSQFYIQTWHGFALKRIEKDAELALSKSYVSQAKKDSENVDIIISEASMMTRMYKNSFWYSGEVVEWGSPRNDVIIDKVSALKNKSTVYEYYGINLEKRTILYAPTFRSNKSLEPYALDYVRVIKACQKRFGGSFVFLVRLHPNISKLSGFVEYNSNVLNATPYPDMQELLSAVDVVISDYSSLMFDFALSMKPCFQFAMDIDDYKEDRNFNIPLDELPFTVATDNDEMEKAILSFDEDEYKKSVELFFDSVGMVRDGNSSKKCAELVRSKCGL